jgi:hypothetical protein
VGLLLVLLPWFSFWDRNYFVRGAVSGLGLVNIGAAVSELIAIFRSRRP